MDAKGGSSQVIYSLRLGNLEGRKVSRGSVQVQPGPRVNADQSNIDFMYIEAVHTNMCMYIHGVARVVTCYL
jgi:hypothetical protein